MTPTLDLHAALQAAEACAREAGTLQRELLRRPLHVTYKGPTDIVTEADKQSEALIVRGLLDAFPDHHIVGEEGGGMGAPADSASYRWYIDPVDGTTNFARRIPHFAVSIGLAGPDGLPLVGIVYQPILDECFTAVRGSGAFLNGEPIRVSTVSAISGALLASGFPYDSWTNPHNNTEEWAASIMRSQGVRCTGSAALDLCWVATGRLDGYWERALNAWDYMAGALIVTEAGGRITDFHGGTATVYQGREIAASNGSIHDDLLAVLLLGQDAPRPAAG